MHIFAFWADLGTTTGGLWAEKAICFDNSCCLKFRYVFAYILKTCKTLCKMHVFGIPGVVWGAFWNLRTTLNAPKGLLKTAKWHFAKPLVKHMVFIHFGHP